MRFFPGQTKRARARAGAPLARPAPRRPGGMRMHLSGRPIEPTVVLHPGRAPKQVAGLVAGRLGG
jgi:hypothetical protein